MPSLLEIFEIIARSDVISNRLLSILGVMNKKGHDSYRLNIVRFNEYLYQHFGSYFYTICTTEGRYLDVKSRNERIGLSRVFHALSEDDGPRVIVMWAEGGLGKTTLASHLIRTAYLREKWFNLLLGGSAKQQSFIDGRLHEYNDAILTFSSLLDVMGEQFGVAQMRSIESSSDKLSFLQRKLRNQRALIVIDNLETLSNTQEIVDGISDLVKNTKGSRVIITTRDGNIRGRNILPVHVEPLSTKEAMQFIDWYIDVRDLGRNSATGFGDTLRRKVVELTGGAPLAIEQLLSQIAVIGRDAIENMQGFNHDWRDFYDFLFSESVERGKIGDAGLEILWYIANLNRPIVLDDLKSLFEQKAHFTSLESTLRTLIALDLVKVGRLLPDHGIHSNSNLNTENEVTLYSVSPLLANYLLRRGNHAVTKSEVQGVSAMSEIEPMAIPVLMKGIDFLFDQASKMMEERREARKARGERDETDKPISEDTKSTSKEEVKSWQPKSVYLKDIPQQVEHCINMIHKYRDNKRRIEDTVVFYGGIQLSPTAVRNEYINCEDEIKKWCQELKRTIEEVYGHKITIIGMD